MSTLTINRRRAPRENPILLDQPPRHAQRLLITDPNRIIDQLPPGFEIRRHAIHPDPFDDAIDLMPSPRALPLGTRKHDPVLDPVIQPTTLRIRQHDLQPRHARLQIYRHAADGTASSRARHEGVELSRALGVDLGTRAVVVGEVVGGVFELVGEEAAAGACGVGGVRGGEAAGGVDELRARDDAGGREAVDLGAEFEKERGFF